MLLMEVDGLSGTYFIGTAIVAVVAASVLAGEVVTRLREASSKGEGAAKVGLILLLERRV